MWRWWRLARRQVRRTSRREGWKWLKRKGARLAGVRTFVGLIRDIALHAWLRLVWSRPTDRLAEQKAIWHLRGSEQSQLLACWASKVSTQFHQEPAEYVRANEHAVFVGNRP